jgi:hypothetical protein
MIMHAMPARWRSGLVTAKRGIGGDLCGRKQRALCDVRRKMGRPELPLKGCYRLNLKAKLVRLDPALRKRLVKSPFCLNELGPSGCALLRMVAMRASVAERCASERSS